MKTLNEIDFPVECGVCGEETRFLRILALVPFIFLAGIILVFLVYAWIINPWRKQKRK